ncbi:hypothetical protein LEMLEM_LOCUS16255 [Lemmus lemmus]
MRKPAETTDLSSWKQDTGLRIHTFTYKDLKIKTQFLRI